MPAYYLMAVSLISFVAALGLPETGGRRGRTAAPTVENDV